MHASSFLVRCLIVKILDKAVKIARMCYKPWRKKHVHAAEPGGGRQFPPSWRLRGARGALTCKTFLAAWLANAP